MEKNVEKNEYLDALNEFYNLKHKYENNLKNNKYALIKNTNFFIKILKF